MSTEKTFSFRNRWFTASVGILILIALLALVFEWAGRVLEAIVTPKGL